MPKCIPRNDCLPFLMRFFLVMEVLVGIAFIIIGLVLQTPPKAAVPICLIILGGLTLCNAFFGCIGSCYYRALLSVYLMIGTLLTIAQAVLVFYIFGKETKVVNDISGYRSDDPNNIINIGSANHVRKEVNVAKWILLVFVCCELVSLFIAFIMRFCVDPEGHYSNFDDEEARYNTQMNQMPNGASRQDSKAAYDSARANIANKYGAFKT
jgi:hypothetical protein